jgi:hypothetical protein
MTQSDAFDVTTLGGTVPGRDGVPVREQIAVVRQAVDE